MSTRRQRRRWAEQGGRPRDLRRRAKQDAIDRHPITMTLGDVVYRVDGLEALAEALESDGHGATVEGNTLYFDSRAPLAPGFTVTITEPPDPRVLEVHYDNRAKRRARARLKSTSSMETTP